MLILFFYFRKFQSKPDCLNLCFHLIPKLSVLLLTAAPSNGTSCLMCEPRSSRRRTEEVYGGNHGLPRDQSKVRCMQVIPFQQDYSINPATLTLTSLSPKRRGRIRCRALKTHSESSSLWETIYWDQSSRLRSREWLEWSLPAPSPAPRLLILSHVCCHVRTHPNTHSCRCRRPLRHVGKSAHTNVHPCDAVILEVFVRGGEWQLMSSLSPDGSRSKAKNTQQHRDGEPWSWPAHRRLLRARQVHSHVQERSRRKG